MTKTLRTKNKIAISEEIHARRSDMVIGLERRDPPYVSLHIHAHYPGLRFRRAHESGLPSRGATASLLQRARCVRFRCEGSYAEASDIQPAGVCQHDCC